MNRLHLNPYPTPFVAIPGGLWLKRDDLFEVAGVRGGKVRTCWHLAQGAKGLVTAGSRASPQVNIVAHIAQKLGIPCRCHTPEGILSPEVKAAQACGAEIVQHRAGYNSVIISRATEDAKARGWANIPFGMECPEAIVKTSQQVMGLPPEVKRLVVPVGSGMSLAGILHGLDALYEEQPTRAKVPILGVMVGASPHKRLARYSPFGGWQCRNVTLVESGSDYHKPHTTDRIPMSGGDVILDLHYEAKCLPFLREGDCLWVVGIRQTQTDLPGLPASR